MKLSLLVTALLFIYQSGLRNAKITGLDANYVTVTTKPSVYFSLPINDLFVKSAQVGDSVWLSFSAKLDPEAVYRDSRKSKE
jgi:hypothetical protein